MNNKIDFPFSFPYVNKEEKGNNIAIYTKNIIL